MPQYQRYEAGTGIGTGAGMRAEVLDASDEEEEEEEGGQVWVSPVGGRDTDYWEQKEEEEEEETREELVRGDREHMYWERKEEQMEQQERERASSHRRTFMDSSKFYKAFE
jgi:hypothetical protein